MWRSRPCPSSRWDVLLRRINTGECTPFLGAGVSRPTLPTGGKLARVLARGYGYPLLDSSNLPRVGQYLAMRPEGDEMDAKQTAAERISRGSRRPPNFLDRDDPHGILASLPLPVYLTTNWDSLMTMALKARGREVVEEVARWNSEVTRRTDRFKANPPSPERPLVFHLHGHIGMAASMVLTEDDYVNFVAALARDFNTVVPPIVQDALTFSSLLFIGYSLTDWNFHVLFRLLMRLMADAPKRLNVSVQLPNNDLIVKHREDEAKRFIAHSLGPPMSTSTGEKPGRSSSSSRNGTSNGTAGPDPDRPNPYPGPRPFTVRDGDRFFGRQPDVLEVASLVRAHYTVLLHAESGAGKTSMVEAGLLPELERRGCEVLPRARVQQLSRPGATRELAGNPYVNNLLQFWLDSEVEPESPEATNLSGFLGRPPDEDGEAQLRVVIVDQFEELFTLYPEHWEDRKDFFEQVQEALDVDRLLRFLFVMRGDYLARLGPYTNLLDDGLRAQYPLDRLRRDNALEAIVDPAERYGRSFAPGVAEELVEELLAVPREPGAPRLLGEHVEAVELQIVCRALWDRLPDGDTVVQRQHLTDLGPIDQVLAGFYDDAVADTVAQTKVKERTLRLWFERKLVTPARTRGVVFKGDETTEGLPNDALERLQEHRLIRSEPRGDSERPSEWYELTHDRLVDAVVDSNRRWLEQRESTRSRQLRAVLAMTIVTAVLLAALLVIQRELRPESLKDLNVVGNIGVAGEIDRYRVSGRLGDRAFVRVRPESGGFGVGLRLLGPNGSEVDTDRAAGPPGAQVLERLPKDGIYTVEVTSPGVGRYRVLGAVVDDQIAGHGEVRGLQLGDSDEVDVVSFQQGRAGPVLIELEAEGELDGYLELLGPGGKLLASVDDALGQADPSIGLYLRRGAYHVLVSADSKKLGVYSLAIRSGSTELEDRTPVYSAIGGDAPAHALAFRGRGTTAFLAMRPTSGSGIHCRLRLFGLQGQLLAEATGGSGADVTILQRVRRGERYVVVASSARATGEGSSGSFSLGLLS